MQASSLLEEMRKEILSRLKKIEGQARGIRGMLEKDGDCTDILVQISALSSAARGWGWSSWKGVCGIVPLPYQACVTRQM
ncbi:MAG: metal-sensitive transcriptional regulator [Thermodesulfobacteriota bacterium]